jgi:hypothetical protein
MIDVVSLAHFGGVGLKEVEASGAVTLGRDHAGTEREARDIGIGAVEGVGTLPGWQQAVIRGAVHGRADGLHRRPCDPVTWLRLIRSRPSLGEEQAAREALARALVAFSDDASMRARIATDARLLRITQD